MFFRGENLVADDHKLARRWPNNRHLSQSLIARNAISASEWRCGFNSVAVTLKEVVAVGELPISGDKKVVFKI